MTKVTNKEFKIKKKRNTISENNINKRCENKKNNNIEETLQE